MGFGPCCVDTRKPKKMPASTSSTEYQGRLDSQQLAHQATPPRGNVQHPIFDDKPTDNYKPVLLGNWSDSAVDKSYFLSSIATCPESGNFADGLPCYPPGYQPIRRDFDVSMKYMTEDEIRLDQIRKNRNKLLARSSSEMLNDLTARGITSKSSSAELMERAQSPD